MIERAVNLGGRSYAQSYTLHSFLQAVPARTALWGSVIHGVDLGDWVRPALCVCLSW